LVELSEHGGFCGMGVGNVGGDVRDLGGRMTFSVRNFSSFANFAAFNFFADLRRRQPMTVEVTTDTRIMQRKVMKRRPERER